VATPSAPDRVVRTGSPAAAASSTFTFGPEVSGHGKASTAAWASTCATSATGPSQVTPRPDTACPPRPASSNCAPGTSTSAQAASSDRSAARLGAQRQSAASTATGSSTSGSGATGTRSAAGTAAPPAHRATRSE
jgi:hypothetical protein